MLYARLLEMRVQLKALLIDLIIYKVLSTICWTTVKTRDLHGEVTQGESVVWGGWIIEGAMIVDQEEVVIDQRKMTEVCQGVVTLNMVAQWGDTGWEKTGRRDPRRGNTGSGHVIGRKDNRESFDTRPGGGGYRSERREVIKVSKGERRWWRYTREVGEWKVRMRWQPKRERVMEWLRRMENIRSYDSRQEVWYTRAREDKGKLHCNNPC